MQVKSLRDNFVNVVKWPNKSCNLNYLWRDMEMPSTNVTDRTVHSLSSSTRRNGPNISTHVY